MMMMMMMMMMATMTMATMTMMMTMKPPGNVPCWATPPWPEFVSLKHQPRLDRLTLPWQFRQGVLAFQMNSRNESAYEWRTRDWQLPAVVHWGGHERFVSSELLWYHFLWNHTRKRDTSCCTVERRVIQPLFFVKQVQYTIDCPKMTQGKEYHFLPIGLNLPTLWQSPSPDFRFPHFHCHTWREVSGIWSHIWKEGSNRLVLIFFGFKVLDLGACWRNRLSTKLSQTKNIIDI